MAIACDVLVIGGGPAGCAAARRAASMGASTILVEKKAAIGDSVACGEGVSAFLLPYAPLPIPKEQFVWEAKGLLFWSPEFSITKIGDEWRGFTISRSSYDLWLAKEAIREGAHIKTSSELLDLSMDENGFIKEVVVGINKEKKLLRPKVVVGADGVSSTLLRLTGRYTPKKGSTVRVHSWEMQNLRLRFPHLHHVYVGDFTPAGYAYIIPKSRTCANVGIGGLTSNVSEENLKENFREFLELPQLQPQLKNAAFVVKKDKEAVWSDLTKESVFGNVIVAGDAANQNLKPFIEGNIPVLVGGDLAGEVAVEMLRGRAVSHEEYLNRFGKRMSPWFDISKTMEPLIGDLYRKGHFESAYLLFLGLTSELFDVREIRTLLKMSKEEIVSLLLSRSKGRDIVN